MKNLLLFMTVILFTACKQSVEPRISDEDIASDLKQNAINLQEAILTQNAEEFNKYVDKNIAFSTGDSNLSKFYMMGTETFDVEPTAKWGEFDLYDILYHLSNMIAFKAREKDVDYLFKIQPGLPKRFIGDPLRIGQILINIVNNALKFTNEGQVLLSISSIKLYVIS